MGLRILSILLLLAGLGCQRGLALRLVEAPNLKPSKKEEIWRQMDASFIPMTVPSADPGVHLNCLIVEPGDWHLAYTVSPTPDGEHGSARLFYTHPGQPPPEPKGTLVLLHGYGERKEMMLPWALTLAQAGYRCIAVDLRGHGQSTGRWTTYGAFEVSDLRQVMDDLARRGLITGQVGVLGISLGASIAIQWAGADPRVRTVVAIEPFDDPQAAIWTMAHGFSPLQRKLRWVSGRTLQAAIKKAPSIAGFRWSDIDVEGAARQASGPIFFIHGIQDTMVPSSNSEKLCASAPKGSRVWLVGGQNHISLAIQVAPLAPAVERWFEARLGP